MFKKYFVIFFFFKLCQAFPKGSAPPGGRAAAGGHGAAASSGGAARGSVAGSSQTNSKKPTGIKTNASGMVAVGHFNVNEKTGAVTYRKPPAQLKSAVSGGKASTGGGGGPAGPAGPAGKNGHPGGMVNGKCMDPPGMGCNNENWGKGQAEVNAPKPIRSLFYIQ